LRSALFRLVSWRYPPLVKLILTSTVRRSPASHVVAGIVARPTGAELLPGDHAPISRIVLAWFGWKIARRSTVSPDDDVVVISLWVTGSEPIIWSTSMTELSGIGASEEPIV